MVGGTNLPHSIQTSVYFRNFSELYLHTPKTSLFKLGKFTDMKVLFPVVSTNFLTGKCQKFKKLVEGFIAFDVHSCSI